MTDWLMVIITAVYVIATIFICGANIKSAKAAREQIEENRKQFEENKRQYLETKLQNEQTERARIIPFLVLESIIISERKGYQTFEITLKNCGNGAAVDLNVKFELEGHLIIAYKNFMTYILTSPFKKTYLQIGELNKFEIALFDKSEVLDIVDRVVIKIGFRDMLGNLYEQKIFFEYSKKDLGRKEQFPPELIDSERQKI